MTPASPDAVEVITQVTLQQTMDELMRRAKPSLDAMDRKRLYEVLRRDRALWEKKQSKKGEKDES